jgi:hypothetical protein
LFHLQLCHLLLHFHLQLLQLLLLLMLMRMLIIRIMLLPGAASATSDTFSKAPIHAQSTITIGVCAYVLTPPL